MSYGTICPYCRYDQGHASYCPGNTRNALMPGYVHAINSFSPDHFQGKAVKYGRVTEDEVKLLMANEGQVYGPRAKYSQRIKSMLETFAKSRGLM